MTKIIFTFYFLTNNWDMDNAQLWYSGPKQSVVNKCGCCSDKVGCFCTFKTYYLNIQNFLIFVFDSSKRFNDLILCYQGARVARLILYWIQIEALDWALEAVSQEICWWILRSLSLGNPSRKIIQGVGPKKNKKLLRHIIVSFVKIIV